MVKYVEENGWEPILLAPTGRAARILSEKTKHDAITIHKGIYNLNDIDEFEASGKDKVSYKFVFKLNHIESNIKRVYFIDEASMISDSDSEGDFFVFGSGKLLSDLIEFVALNNKGRMDKIIFIGDNAQLPPVTDKFSSALNAEYLQQKFQINVIEYELTEVVRQQSDNGILVAATYLRDLLRNPLRNSFKMPPFSNDFQEIKVDEVIDQFLSNVENGDLMSSVIINYSNKSAYDFNMQLRQKLFPNQNNLSADDILLINQNNYNYDPPLLNGMFVRVVEAAAAPEIRSGLKSYDQKGNDCKVNHKFRRIVIEVQKDGKTLNLPCFILENFLFNPKPSLDYAENIALYIDFKMRNPNLKPHTKEFRDTLRGDPYFNALRVKFGYAVTCHKAQGGEWEKAIVNLDVNQGKLSDRFLRWTYTAITRASKQAFLFNVPSAGQFSKLIYQPEGAVIKEMQIADNNLIKDFNLPGNLHETLQQLGFNTQREFLKDKFIEVLARIDGTDIKINAVKHNQYHEGYQFICSGRSAGIAFYYDGKDRFTKIVMLANMTSDEGFYQEVQILVSSPFSFRIMNEIPLMDVTAGSLDSDEETETAFFDTTNKHIEPLYLELNNLSKTDGIKIVSISHLSYQERYYFTKGGQKACIDFWYDHLGRFTRAKPLVVECNSNILLEMIARQIESIKTC